MSKLIGPRLAIFGALAFVGAFVGCGDGEKKYDANVQGTVTIDGELARGGSVTFTPTEQGPTAVGTIASDGSYSLRIGQGNVGNPDTSVIPSGDYVVTAMITGPSIPDESSPTEGPPPAGPKLIADKYGSRKTSDLKFEVKTGPNIIVLALDGPWADPPAEEPVDEGEKPHAEEDANDSQLATPAKDAAAQEAAETAPIETTPPAGEEAKP